MVEMQEDCLEQSLPSCRQRFRIPANAHYLLPVGKKKPTIIGRLKRVLRYEKDNQPAQLPVPED
jgi:hypothetical protein